jgi:type IV pilus assembly protein PilY1
VYAGPNDHTATDTATDNSYSTYLVTKAAVPGGMAAQVLVNANDGFTNVIDAASGKRLYAYLPSSTLPMLYTVADTGYINGTSHTFLNDGQINVADVLIGGGWKTVAFTGTGAGGKTFSAIQLYDATAGNAINALWEISAPTSNTASNVFNDLGYAYAKPEVARLPDGRWAAFIANGYGSNSGVAALYVVNVADGSLITKLVVNSSEKDNGLSSVKLSVDANSTVIAAYGGDLKGRMWKFDLSSTALTSWGLAFSGKPLFTAPGGTTQPITAQPYLLKLKTGGRMVYFGTGKFIETADKSTTYQQGFYAVRDIDGATGNYTTANLTAQAITGTFVSSGSTYMTTSTNTVDYTSKMGWYLPLTYGSTLVGERVIFQATYSYGRIIFTTAGVDISDPCSSQGFGRLVILDAVSGGMLTTATLDTNGDGVVSSTDLASSGKVYNTGYSGTPSIIQAADGSITAIGNKTDGVVDKSTLTGVGGSNRVMWRQIQ